MKAWVFVAAESREFCGIVRRLEDVQKLEWSVDFARSGKSNGRRWVLLANGPGPRLAAEAVGVIRRRGIELDALISTGFCGALDPDLAIGDIVAGSRVLDPDGRREFPACLPETTRNHVTGAVISVDRVATTPAEKLKLRTAGGVAVEMEAAGVAAWASELGVPLFCVRAVSDTAGQGFGIDFNATRDAEGRFGRGRIVREALRRPFSRVPELLRLRKSCQLAAEALGEFLADCRF
jgi:adenosylhomocysteine nucleosidase